MFSTRKFTPCNVPLISLAAALYLFAAMPSEAAQNGCADSVQGRITWAGDKSPKWTAANLAALCKDAETSTEPGKCFKRVMSGSVNYGGGTSWNPSNALDLCAGARDANARISCFEGKIAQGRGWDMAIGQCRGTVDPGIVGKSATPPVKASAKMPAAKSAAESPPARVPAKKSQARPASPPPVCSPTGDCDGDGVSLAEGDCDDADASRYPGATEIADFAGHDEDCNDATYGTRDEDGDGFTDARVCNGSNCGDDCDDTRRAVNPNAAELPNRRDDDCNGVIDDHLEGWWNPAQ